MNKKWIFPLLMCFILLSLAGCSGDKKTTPDATQTTVAEQTTAADATIAEEAPNASTVESTGFPVVDSFNRYTEDKNKVFNKLQELIAQDPEHNMMTLGLLAPAVMDLEMIPIVFLPTPDAAKVLGNLSCEVSSSGEDFAIKLVNGDNKNLDCSGKYDQATNSLYYESIVDDKMTAICEYIQVDQNTYYVQYYAFDQKKAIRMVFDQKDMALSIKNQETPDPSIYKQAPKDGFDFAKNDEFYILMQNGVIVEAVEKQ